MPSGPPKPKKYDPVKTLKKISRDSDPHKGSRRGGFHGTPKGNKGYTRKEKHPDQSNSESLTPEDETYRELMFPIADVLSWDIPAEGQPGTDGGPGMPYGPDEHRNDPDEHMRRIEKDQDDERRHQRNWEQEERKKMANTVAELNWSTHKSETFDDTGEKGLHPAWGLKSIIDRGVKPHEKPDADKRIGEAENQTTQRDIPSKKFKSYSMVRAFNWILTDFGEEEWVRTRYRVQSGDLPFPGAASPFGSKDEDDETEESDE